MNLLRLKKNFIKFFFSLNKFNVKKGIEFIKTKKELYKVFFWKSILLLFLYNIVFAFGIHLLFNLITHYNPRITQGFQSILLTIPNILYILTFPNLIGQLFNKTNK